MTVKDLFKFKIEVEKHQWINHDLYQFIDHNTQIHFQIYQYEKNKIVNGINRGKFRSVVWGLMFEEMHVNHKYNLENL